MTAHISTPAESRVLLQVSLCQLLQSQFIKLWYKRLDLERERERDEDYDC